MVKEYRVCYKIIVPEFCNIKQQASLQCKLVLKFLYLGNGRPLQAALKLFQTLMLL